MVVRLAIGARPSQILRLVLVEGMRLALVGLAIGTATTFAKATVVRRSFSEGGRTPPYID